MHALTSPAAPEPDGWSARLRLRLERGERRTLLSGRQRSGPLGVQRPFYPEGDTCHVYLLHPPGGAVGGDRLDIGVTAAAGARALLTTPGATKFYRSSGARADVTQRLTAERGCRLEWLPQENIYFSGARVRASTRIDLHDDARVVAWETHCLGLPARTETFDQGELVTRLEVWRADTPLLLECQRLTPHTRRRAAGLRALPVTATLLASAPDDDLTRRMQAAIAEVTQPGVAGLTRVDDLLVVRYLGASTAQARELFVRLWRELRPALLGRDAVAPRIWAT